MFRWGLCHIPNTQSVKTIKNGEVKGRKGEEGEEGRGREREGEGRIHTDPMLLALPYDLSLVRIETKDDALLFLSGHFRHRRALL